MGIFGKTSQEWRFPTSPIAVGFMILCLDQEALSSLAKASQIRDLLGYWCISEECSALFVEFGDSFQWHFCWCNSSGLYGHPQRKLVHDLRCQPVISLCHCVDSSAWSVTSWWLSSMGCTYAESGLQHRGCSVTVLRTSDSGSWKSHQTSTHQPSVSAAV